MAECGTLRLGSAYLLLFFCLSLCDDCERCKGYGSRRSGDRGGYSNRLILMNRTRQIEEGLKLEDVVSLVNQHEGCCVGNF